MQVVGKKLLLWHNKLCFLVTFKKIISYGWIAQWFRYPATKPEVGSLIPHGMSPGRRASLGGFGQAAQSQDTPGRTEDGKPILSILYLKIPEKDSHKSELTWQHTIIMGILTYYRSIMTRIFKSFMPFGYQLNFKKHNMLEIIDFHYILQSSDRSPPSLLITMLKRSSVKKVIHLH